MHCCFSVASASAGGLPFVAEAPDAVVEAVPALAQVFSAAPLQASPLEATGEEEASQPLAEGTPAVRSDAAEHTHAALQLAALRVLLLFLPLPLPQVTLSVKLQFQFMDSCMHCNSMVFICCIAAVALVLAWHHHRDCKDSSMAAAGLLKG